MNLVLNLVLDLVLDDPYMHHPGTPPYYTTLGTPPRAHHELAGYTVHVRKSKVSWGSI